MCYNKMLIQHWRSKVMTRTKNKKDGNKKQIIVSILIGSLSTIIILGMFLFSTDSRFVQSMHGRKICNKIANTLNRMQISSYLIENGVTIEAPEKISKTVQIKAIDSEYIYQKRDENNQYSRDHICKVWIKGSNLTNRPYVLVKGKFYLTDKHSAKLNYTEESINEIVKSNETLALSFEYDANFKEAQGIFFTFNELSVPIQEEEYCIEQSKLYAEAKNVYKYEYNDLLSCNCAPKSFYFNRDSRCDIFNNEKIRENCILLSMLVPNCNKWIEKHNRENGYTNLMSAASNEDTNTDTINELVKSGIDINAKDNNGMTALMYAASQNKNLQIIRTLIKSGANVNAKDNFDNTALMYAVRLNSNPDIVTELIKAGADVSCKNKNEATALLLALENKNTDIMKAFIEGSAGAFKQKKKDNKIKKDKVKNERENKTNKVKDNSDCKNYSECKTIAQKKKYCKCIEYERAKGDKNIILAPQPQECIIFCRTNANKNK